MEFDFAEEELLDSVLRDEEIYGPIYNHHNHHHYHHYHHYHHQLPPTLQSLLDSCCTYAVNSLATFVLNIATPLLR